MVLALPRSGTAWVANLLTTDTSLCIHEALEFNSLSEIDKMGVQGVCETSAFMHIDEINAHQAKKLIIERPFAEIQESCKALGFPELPPLVIDLMDQIKGYRIAYKDLFNYEVMAVSYRYLLNKELSRERHALLCRLDIQNSSAIERTLINIRRFQCQSV